jgi:Tol biopolymer transport system component
MKRNLVVALTSAVVASACCAHVPSEAAPYLGQKPPGTTPRVFAPRVVSAGDIIHSRLAISPDGHEMFWSTVDTTTFSTRLISMREVGGRWSEPQSPPFAKEGSTQSPLFSPDGRRLYYRARNEKGWATVFVEKSASGWSAPRSDGVLLDCGSSFTRSGRAYFSSVMKTKTWNTGIFSARFSTDGYSDIAPLDSMINVPNAIDYTPCVSPDESFLLFSSNRPLVGDTEDMHVLVSFRTVAGRWSTPRRVSDIPGRFPSLSPDGRYLFFCGDDGNIYWVDASVIDALRPDHAPAPSEQGHGRSH